jgi:hypothetical protein
MGSALRSLGLVLAVLTLAFGGCADGDSVTGVCPTVARVSIIAEVVDSQGRPAAVGTTVTVTKGAITGSRVGFVDPLRIPVFADNVGGRVDVTINKPWHQEVKMNGIRVPEGPCGVTEPATVRVTIALVPGAPAVRQVVLAPYDYGFGIAVCGIRGEVSGFALTDGAVSGEIVWVSRDPRLVVIEPHDTLLDGHNTAWMTIPCDAPVGSSTYVIGMAKADPSVRDSFEVTVTL